MYSNLAKNMHILYKSIKKNKLFNNAWWSLIEYLSQPIVLIVSAPILINTLGIYKYGIFLFATTLINCASFINSGIGFSVTKLTSEVGVSFASVILYGKKLVYISIFIVGIIVFFWLCGPVPPQSLNLVPNYLLKVVLTIYIVLSIFLDMLDNVFTSALKGRSEFKNISNIATCYSISQYIIIILLSIFFKNIILILCAVLPLSVARTYVKYRLTMKLVDNTDFQDSEKFKDRFIDFAKWGWLLGIGGMLFGSADKFFVGQNLDSAGLAIYSSISQIAIQTHTLSASALYVLFPYFSNMTSKKNEVSYKNFLDLYAINILLVLPCAILLFTFRDVILFYWLQISLSENFKTAYNILVLSFLLQSFTITPYYFLNGRGKIKSPAIVIFIAGSIMLAIIYSYPSDNVIFIASISRLVQSFILTYIIFLALQDLKQGNKNCAK